MKSLIVLAQLTSVLSISLFPSNANGLEDLANPNEVILNQSPNEQLDPPNPSHNNFRPQADNESDDSAPSHNGFKPHPPNDLEDLAHPFRDPSKSAVALINKCKWVDGHPCPKSSYVCWNRVLDKEFSVEKPEGNVCWVCLGDQCTCEGTKENGKCEKWLQDIRKCEKCEDKQ
ncbi:hypothetical protein K502DRAFT_360628 [Neoconidiobolus thromboides FSU 785]|nr:hypothetical protein K502DRAFT_360628 [Neoconidiobolus thromboides FSU 785]